MAIASTEHLDPLQLDALRTGEGSESERRHVAECAECRGSLAELEALAAGLRPLAQAPFEIPEEHDRRILWLARKQAAVARKATPQPAHRRMVLGGRWAAAAAVVLAIGAITWRQRREAIPLAPTVARRSVTDDIDGDGRVDILDAFALARRLQERSAAAHADVNGDGVVDQRDVDAIARAAVALGKV